MYNRYVPKPDGSYQRNTLPDSKPPVHNLQPNQPVTQDPSPQSFHYPPKKQEGIFSFLRQLLPRDFDTTDLLIVLIILLMAGDCQEQRNDALLTLALYFFM